MTVDQIITAIATVGFPAVALVVLARWVKDRIESSEKSAAEREQRMGARIDKLEDFIRTEQAEQLDVVTEALRRNTDALDRANGTMSQLATKLGNAN